MATNLDSATSPKTYRQKASSSFWLKLGVVAGASLLLGGLGAAWWYRKTLRKLQQAEHGSLPPEFKNREGYLGDDD